MSFYRMGDMPTDIKAEYRPFCKECDWVGKRTSDLNFAQDQADDHDKDHADTLYNCPWRCPVNIFTEDVEYHRQWHIERGEDPDIAGGVVEIPAVVTP